MQTVNTQNICKCFLEVANTMKKQKNFDFPPCVYIIHERSKQPTKQFWEHDLLSAPPFVY